MFLVCFQQNKSQELISTQGEVIEDQNTDASISFSVGEPVITTLTDANNIGRITQGFQQVYSKYTNLEDNYCLSNSNYDVLSFKGTSLYAVDINANQYNFTFTEVNSDRTPIINADVFYVERNSEEVRLKWAKNIITGTPINQLDKTYKVEVEGIFNNEISVINKVCYVNSPKSNITSTRLDDPYCSSITNFDVTSFKATSMYAKDIYANEYRFIFTEVNSDRTPIANAEVFEVTRNTTEVRLKWALNTNTGVPINQLDKTYKVEVQGIFSNGTSQINEACYVNTPKSNVLSTRLDDPYCSITNYDVASFKATSMYAQDINAIQYKFIFTEVNIDRTAIPNAEVFEVFRNNTEVRLHWAENTNGRINELDKTYKVEVQGIFSNATSPINEACYVNTPKSNILSTRLDDPYCSPTTNYDVPNFKYSSMYALDINANEYKFTFTEVNANRTPIPGADVFEVTRITEEVRLYWAKNTINQQPLNYINKTYKVEVEGIFGSGNTPANDACYINTLNSSNLPTTELTNTFCQTSSAYQITSFFSHSLYSTNIDAAKYRFTFTEVDANLQDIPNSDPYVCTRNNREIRMAWPKNSLNQSITDLNTNYKVQVEGLFYDGTNYISSGFGNICYVRTPSTYSSPIIDLTYKSNFDNKTTSLTIFPNPNNGSSFYINAYGFNDEENEFIISIFDLNGKEVFKEHTGINTNQIIKEIQLKETLANGVYLTKVAKGSSFKILKLIINQ